MNKQPINDDELQQHLQQPAPAPDANAKARHMAAAMAAFDAQQVTPQGASSSSESVVEDLSTTIETGVDEKKSNLLQGFLQRLRLTRDTNHHGSEPMRHSNVDNRSIWQKPALLSAIAASSLAVVAGLTFTQHFVIHSGEQPLQESIALDSAKKSQPIVIADNQTESAAQPMASIALQEQEQEAKEEIVVTGVRQTLARSQELGRTAAAAKTAPVAPIEMREAMVSAAPAALADQVNMQPPQEFRDRFEDFKENAVVATSENPVSTFSIDVDTASYSFVRRMLNNGQLPEKDAVRSEELINYFDYAYPAPKDRTTPFATYTTVVDSPWKAGNKLIHIGIQGYQLAASEIPQSNLVFLLDVSGSMDEPSKLPLIKQSMSLLLDTLKPDDTIAIVVYAGAAGTVLEPTKVKEKNKILAALNNLQAGGSTAGAEGIALAYQLAEANFNAQGVNRIILATDGDFNVGQTGDEALQDFVERKREKGIYLSVLGFGQGNYQDEMMQTLAQNGNGTAAYIDTLSEAQKVLVTEATSNLFPIAKDVKIQVEFNPNTVKEYRLIGYETRALNREDFSNDKVDAGEIGAGQRVTAIYEITPVGAKSGLLEESRYQKAIKVDADNNSEYAFLRLRYKLPNADQSKLIETPIEKNVLLEENSAYQQEVNFSIAVAGFAQLLRGSHYAGNFTYDNVIALAQANKGKDEYGYRTEFVQLVRKAKIAK
ncbi:VWA domain-containing protein [Cellvibrio sp. UBA7661]|uniref:vWA domain-containing protein n=1 Tax=Cellvibrio sp. UBA7661 TaxID=1946311 RepID=UPI002F355827